jgi:hypothetical protein
MGNKVISIMGTNGSGKSTLVRKFLPDDAKIIEHPLSRVYDCGTHYVIGRYDTDCGGLDGLKDFYDVIPLVMEFIKTKDVFIEGVLFGGIYKTPAEIDDMVTALGHKYYWTKIEITLEECVESVLIRRVRGGKFDSFEPSRVTNKYNGARSSFNKAIDTGRLGFFGNRLECEEVIRNLLLNNDETPYLTKKRIEGPNHPGNYLGVQHVTKEMRDKYYQSTDLNEFWE